MDSSPESWKLLVAVLALLTSLTAMVVSWRTATKLKEKDIELKKHDIEHNKRKLFITALWDRLVDVKALNPGNVTRERILEVLNTLELVALCWEENVVDRRLIALAFGDNYIDRVAEIRRIVIGSDYSEDTINKLRGDGPSYLRQYPKVRSWR